MEGNKCEGFLLFMSIVIYNYYNILFNYESKKKMSS